MQKVRYVKDHHKLKATVLSYILVSLAGLATDIYLPSMPAMATSLHVSDQQVQLTLSSFLISYGISQFFVGSLLDTYGRYVLSMISLVLFSTTSFLIAASENIDFIVLLRVVQGINIGFIAVAKRAFFVDVYEGDKRKYYVSIITIVWSVAPIVAPFLGGYLEHFFSWRANFYFLGIYSGLIFICEIFYSGETLNAFSKFKIKNVLSSYNILLTTPAFLTGMGMAGVSFGIVMIYGLSGAFILEHRMGYSPVAAGYAALVLGIAWMCGGFLAKGNIHKPLFKKTFIASFVQVIIVILMIAEAFFVTNIYTLVAFAGIIHFMGGFNFTNYFTRNLTMFPNMAGLAAGVTSGGNYIITSLLTYTIALAIQAQNQKELGLSYAIAVAIIILIVVVFQKRKGT
ncbi:MAG: MFS transporter [Sphingobacteriales bacterium 44-15]|nr:MAG: MFS transporter [Sphingobacteriales bacterium 44-15]